MGLLAIHRGHATLWARLFHNSGPVQNQVIKDHRLHENDLPVLRWSLSIKAREVVVLPTFCPVAVVKTPGCSMDIL